MKETASFTIDDIQSKFGIDHMRAEKLFCELEEENKIVCLEGNSYKCVFENMDSVTQISRTERRPRVKIKEALMKYKTKSPDSKKIKFMDEKIAEPNHKDVSLLITNIRGNESNDISELIGRFVRKNPSYDDKYKTFHPMLKISFPSDVLFQFEYAIDKGNHYFTDNGTTKKYLESITKNITKEISSRWIEEQLLNLEFNTTLDYTGGKIVKDLKCCNNENDLDDVVFYFLKQINAFLIHLDLAYSDKILTQTQEIIISRMINKFLLNMLNKEFLGFIDEEECATWILQSITRIHENISKKHAMDIAKKLIKIAIEQKNKNLLIFQILLKKITIISSMEFKILQAEVR